MALPSLLEYLDGFYPVEINETTYFFERTKNSHPEMNFNKCVYFYSDDGQPKSNVVSNVLLRSLVSNPEDADGKLNKLMMYSESGDFSPAHLPNPTLVLGLPKVQAIIDELDKQPSVNYNGISHDVIPDLLMDHIDPMPVIVRSGPIYLIRMKEINTQIGCYTDAIQFFKIGNKINNLDFTVFHDKFIEDDPSSRFYAINMKPEISTSKKTLPLGGTIILWNARQITRPSFAIHFEEIFNTHNPLFIILTEVGVAPTNCERVLKKIGTKMNWRLDCAKGVVGGILLMWDKDRVDSELIVADFRSIIDLRVIGSIKASSKEKEG